LDHVGTRPMIEIGATVRLNEAGLHWVRPMGRRVRAEWPGRTALVKVLYRDGLRAQVMWAGNKSLSDGVPLKFLEPVKL
jgi:hypothetical protein